MLELDRPLQVLLEVLERAIATGAEGIQLRAAEPEQAQARARGDRGHHGHDHEHRVEARVEQAGGEADAEGDQLDEAAGVQQDADRERVVAGEAGGAAEKPPAISFEPAATTSTTRISPPARRSSSRKSVVAPGRTR